MLGRIRPVLPHVKRLCERIVAIAFFAALLSSTTFICHRVIQTRQTAQQFSPFIPNFLCDARFWREKAFPTRESLPCFRFLPLPIPAGRSPPPRPLSP